MRFLVLSRAHFYSTVKMINSRYREYFSMSLESILPGKVYVYGKRDTPPPHAVKINTTSTSKYEWKAFSPFFLGPIDVEVKKGQIKRSLVFENAWQYLKRYEIHTDSEYEKWQNLGFANPRAVRYPMGRGAKPLYSMWKGERLSYIDARKQIYAPLYAKLVEETSSTSSLLERYISQEEISHSSTLTVITT